ncbi:hypothetical protein B0T22DRAFT_107483 [Podospora appendiculata]|uniref:RBR-type E3 ubiquitin transferase n=1 Tax=Podospora appendiculata TaxID=314037 RepID=A0AAE0XLD6_9PEZI|nr:hypothetical protein B0T22DRAFT_107483 [Podospora appendiculata]
MPGSMGLPSLSPANLADSLTRPPELRGGDGDCDVDADADADYMREVLGYTDGRTEADTEHELVEKATALGIRLPISRPSTTAKKPTTTGVESADTLVSQHGRTASTSSHGTTSTALTSQTSHRSTVIPATLTESTNLASRRRSKSLNFSYYDKYLSHTDPTLHQPKFLHQPPVRPERAAGLLISAGTRKSVRDLKRSISVRLRRRRPIPSLTIISCICCREDFIQEHKVLQTLPCGHTYCQHCLAVMITQSTRDESKMPPRCCTQPIPGPTIKAVLTRDEQQAFLKAVLQYSTPWESRIFCPNISCGEFIPPRTKIDPKHPFETTCKSCKTRVCVTCKRNAHRIGQDCPEDWELDAVLKMGEKSGWRRCYKCRTLVELSQGCTHMTCRCKAQFCYICGAVWDPTVGCPNFCNGEEELERRRMEEELRLAELEAEKQAKEEAEAAEEVARQEAEKRTAQSAAFRALGQQQELERTRFEDFERKAKELMWTRQSKRRVALREKYEELTDKMKERHAKTEQHLEDRQIEAEIELQSTLDQSERSIRIQLKYMEAYCKGDCKISNRVVTPKHLEQLDQQYRVRDGMERRHKSHINVLREKQAKRMEELIERHGKEMETLADKKAGEVEDLALEFANQEDAHTQIFRDRKAKLRKRWELAIEILRVEQERLHGKRFTPIPAPTWVTEDALEEDGLSAIAEDTVCTD